MQELKFEQVEDVNGGKNPGTSRRERRENIGSNPISGSDVAKAGGLISAAGTIAASIPTPHTQVAGRAAQVVGSAMIIAGTADGD